MTSISPPTSPVVLDTCSRQSSLEDMYKLMYAIRIFEQSLLDMFDIGALSGTTHTSIGQEATAVGVISSLDVEKDIVFSNHRGHGHFLSYCGEIERLYLELMGKPDGICGGRGGSQHLHHENFYSNGIQGGIVPVSTGMSLAEKMIGSGVVTTVFLGDGTLGEGVIYESFNIASLWELPILYVIENNGFAQTTPFELQVAGSIKDRPTAFGIRTEELSTTEVLKIKDVATDLIEEIRSEVRPRCLVINNYRLGPHSKGDDLRDPREVQEAWNNDPVQLLRRELPDAESAEAEVRAAVETARQRALDARSHGL